MTLDGLFLLLTQRKTFVGMLLENEMECLAVNVFIARPEFVCQEFELSIES